MTWENCYWFFMCLQFDCFGLQTNKWKFQKPISMIIKLAPGSVQSLIGGEPTNKQTNKQTSLLRSALYFNKRSSELIIKCKILKNFRIIRLPLVSLCLYRNLFLSILKANSSYFFNPLFLFWFKFLFSIPIF